MASSLPRVVPLNAPAALRRAANALREAKKVDPRDRYVVLLPGADSARPKMAFDLLGSRAAEDVFQQASEITKRNLLKICIEAENTDLTTSYENQSLAAFTMNHAIMRKLAALKPHTVELTKAFGGIGVGFINGLVSTGAMTFENGLDLVWRQAQAMERAAKVVPNAQVRVRILPATRKRLICQAAIDHCLKLGIPPEIAVCAVSKQLKSHVMEISGHAEAISYLEREGERLFKFRYISRIDSGHGAYHTALMAPAQSFIGGYIGNKLKLDPDYIKEPENFTVYSATAGCRLRKKEHIKKDLIKFSTSKQQVEQMLHCMFKRPKSLAQPNVMVLWDRSLMRNLEYVNRLAYASAKLIK